MTLAGPFLMRYLWDVYVIGWVFGAKDLVKDRTVGMVKKHAKVGG